MSDLVISNAAMNATIAVIKAAQQMSASSIGLLAGAVNTADTRAALPYSRVLDKLV
jgi:hypothetical protein